VQRKFDPYTTLGVDRGASEEEIRAAAKRAAKESHPDVGGDPDTFNDTRRALAILTNRKKRAEYDRTGDADDPPADNREAAAHTIIAGKVDELMNAYLMSDFDAAKDPRKIDVAAAIKRSIQKDVQVNRTIREAGKKHVATLEQMSERFTKNRPGFDFIKRLLDDKIREVRSKIAEFEEVSEDLNRAAEIMADYSFRKDEVMPAATTNPYGMNPILQSQNFFFRS